MYKDLSSGRSESNDTMFQCDQSEIYSAEVGLFVVTCLKFSVLASAFFSFFRLLSRELCVITYSLQILQI